MHEASIAQNVINEIASQIDAGRIEGKVSAVVLRIGKLTSVVPDNLRFLFGVLAEGTVLEGASLDIEEVPITAECLSCWAKLEIEDVSFVCTRCFSHQLRILKGRELLIEAVEVA